MTWTAELWVARPWHDTVHCLNRLAKTDEHALRSLYLAVFSQQWDQISCALHLLKREK